MSCHEIRPLIPVVSRGEMGLTEWALVEVHVKHCADCRREQERLDPANHLTPGWRARVSALAGLPGRARDQLAIPITRATTATTAAAGGWAARGAAGAVSILSAGRDGTLATGRRALAGVAGAGDHVRSALSIARTRAARSRDASAAAARAGLARVARLRVPAPRAIGPVRPWRAGAAMIAASRARFARVLRLRARLRPTLTIRPARIAPVAVSVAALALAVYVLPHRPASVAPVPPAEWHISVTDPGRRLEPIPRSAPAPGALAAPASRPRPAGAHVVGRLSIKDRSASERDLAALLAQTGGTQIGRHRDMVFTVVDAVVPSSGYRAFTDGLARIGSWQVEAERSPLPRAVRMSIRIGDD